ncbi:MAG: thioredoxin domain-containing protein [Bacillota bacterium]|nr:thioredoxin domain-containing protein [Bacillota bacterium]
MQAIIKPNKLINEKSPYLLQHAHNPIDWYPWGEEAFEKAKKQDKPVFLSIGYSTCHWCHVMERESFEKEDVAEVLNRNFVSIKVDREERPDIDGIYMNVCQLMTGSGGWPLSIFMDGNKKPFFAGTYFPRESFLSLLNQIRTVWDTDRERLLKHSGEIFRAIEPETGEAMQVDENTPGKVFSSLKRTFDRDYGGFSLAPKFPSPHNLLFLMRYYFSTGDKDALTMCGRTLEHMRRGGIFDQIGFGFSRYSTDREWLVPHFEKMLYDNALLCMAYTEYAAITKDYASERTAREIIKYLGDRMRSPSGGFYSAEDADSEGVEGKFYVFSRSEVKDILKEDSEEFCGIFDITEKGNFEGKNILNLINSEYPGENREFVENCRKKIYEYREKRVRPYLDDKILTSWNGLVIAALAMAGRVFGEREYIKAAEEAAMFIKNNMMTPDGRLKARFRGGEARFMGYDEDYAYFIWGLTELYFATFDEFFLELALSLNNKFFDKFFDKKNGGFYQNDEDSEKMPVRLKMIYDGATPSANAVEVYNLLRLSRLAHDETLEETAKKTIEAFMGEIGSLPSAYVFHSINIQYLKNGGTDIVLSAKEKSQLNGMISLLNEKYRPFATVRVLAGEQKEYKALDGKPTAYVCRGFTCAPPVTELSELEKLLIQG